MSLELTDENFDETLKDNEIVVVDFWAAWCGPCRMVGPIIEQLGEEYKDKAFVGKLDVDGNQEASTKYAVSSIPTVVVFKNGEEVDRKIGASVKADYAAMIDKHLK